MSKAITFIKLETLWWGVCIGGRHYTGELWVNDRKVELRRKISRKEAKELGETQELLWMQRFQRDTNKFDSLGQLERFAKKWCEANIEGDWLLLQDRHNPSHVVAGKGTLVSRIPAMNLLAEAWDKVPDSLRRGELWDETYKTWDALLKP